jgi:hypothetical protein
MTTIPMPRRNNKREMNSSIVANISVLFSPPLKNNDVAKEKKSQAAAKPVIELHSLRFADCLCSSTVIRTHIGWLV